MEKYLENFSEQTVFCTPRIGPENMSFQGMLDSDAAAAHLYTIFWVALLYIYLFCPSLLVFRLMTIWINQIMSCPFSATSLPRERRRDHLKFQGKLHLYFTLSSLREQLNEHLLPQQPCGSMCINQWLWPCHCHFHFSRIWTALMLGVFPQRVTTHPLIYLLHPHHAYCGMTY